MTYYDLKETVQRNVNIDAGVTSTTADSFNRVLSVLEGLNYIDNNIGLKVQVMQPRGLMLFCQAPRETLQLTFNTRKLTVNSSLEFTENLHIIKDWDDIEHMIEVFYGYGATSGA